MSARKSRTKRKVGGVSKQGKTKRVKSELEEIPGVGGKLAAKLGKVGVFKVADLRDADAEELYAELEKVQGKTDRCVLYVFRCAIYYATVDKDEHDAELLKWWNWKDEDAATTTSSSPT